jgi:hypothetical protein
MYSVKSPAHSGKNGRSENTDSVGTAACYTGFLDFVHCLVFKWNTTFQKLDPFMSSGNKHGEHLFGSSPEDGNIPIF